MTEGPLASAPVLPGPAADHNGADDDAGNGGQDWRHEVPDSAPDDGADEVEDERTDHR